MAGLEATLNAETITGVLTEQSQLVGEIEVGALQGVLSCEARLQGVLTIYGGMPPDYGRITWNGVTLTVS